MDVQTPTLTPGPCWECRSNSTYTQIISSKQIFLDLFNANMYDIALFYYQNANKMLHQYFINDF